MNRRRGRPDAPDGEAASAPEPTPSGSWAYASGLRLTVDVDTFAAWRRAVPGLAVPSDFALDADVPGPADPDGRPTATAETVPVPMPVPMPLPMPMPPFVAASFAVHTAAHASLCLRTSDALSRAVVCVSVHRDLAAVMVRAARAAARGGAPGGWVQFALIPATEVAGEVVAWIPDAQDAALTAPPGACLQVEVAAADDAVVRQVASWVVRDGRWFALSPDGTGVRHTPVTPDDLALLVAEVLVAAAEAESGAGDA